MADSRKNTVSIRIYAETQESLLDAQLATKRRTGTKPSLADLLREAWTAYTTPGSTGDDSPQKTSVSLDISGGIAPHGKLTHTFDIQGLTPEQIERVQAFIDALKNGAGDWQDVLDRIIASGHAVAIEAITRNLHAFDVLINTDEQGRSENYQVPDINEIIEAHYRRFTKIHEEYLADAENSRGSNVGDQTEHQPRRNRRAG